MTDHWVCNQSNTTGATRGAGTVYPVGIPKLLVGVHVAHVIIHSLRERV